jgi:DNA uptake protein ComE-like DNA-binding protein
MMLITFKPVLDWFGFTRRERRASFILLIFIAIITGIRFIPFFSHREPEIVKLEALQSETYSSEIRVSQASHTENPTPVSRPGKRTVLELNSCDSASLVRLPAIGPVLARRIIRYRNLLGGFLSVSQLKEVYGLSDSAYKIIKPWLKADTSLVRKVKLSSVEFKQLSRFPYLDKSDVSSILKFRDRNGKIESLDELVRNGVISAEKAGRMRGYVEAEKGN